MTDTSVDPRLFSRNPAERRAFRDEVGRGIGRYIPPELRPLLGFVADATPSAALERAGSASMEMVAPDRTAMERVGSLGAMLSETAGVAAPALVGRAIPSAEAAQEVFMGISAPMRSATDSVFERLNQPGPMPERLMSGIDPEEFLRGLRARAEASDAQRLREDLDANDQIRAERGLPPLSPAPRTADFVPDDFGFFQDNPALSRGDTDWLRGRQEAAEASYDERRGITGSTTATLGSREQDMFLPTDFLRRIPGLNNENPVPGTAKYDALMRDVQEQGFLPDQAGNRIVLGVNHRGEPYLIEGNNRTAVAADLGIPNVRVEVVYKNGGEMVDGPFSPENISRIAARGPSEAGATSSPAGIRVFHASPDQIEGDFRVSDRDVGLHFANNPALAQNAAVKSALERPDTVGSIRPQEFVINATPEQVADIPASSNRFDFYDILESLREDGRIDQGLFDEIYDGLEEIEGSVSNVSAMMQEQNRFFSERLSRDADIKALRYYNEFDAGPTWADFEQGRESSSVVPDYSYIVLDSSAVKRPENFAQGGAVMMRSDMSSQLSGGIGGFAGDAKNMFNRPKGLEGFAQYMQAGGEVLDLTLSMQEAQSPAFRTQYEDDFFVNSPLGYAAYEDGTPFAGDAGKWAEPAAPMEEMLRGVRREVGAPDRTDGSGNPQNVQDLIQIFEFLQRKDDSELTQQERGLLEEIPRYLSMTTGMANGGEVGRGSGQGSTTGRPVSGPATGVNLGADADFLTSVRNRVMQQSGVDPIRVAMDEGVDPDLFLRLIAQESGGRATARSEAGAYGFTQLMEGTARDLGVDRTDPEQNLRGGARYLRQQLDSFQEVPLALAAYNAGPGAVRRFGGIPPYSETRNYVARILGMSGGEMGISPLMRPDPIAPTPRPAVQGPPLPADPLGEFGNALATTPLRVSSQAPAMPEQPQLMIGAPQQTQFTRDEGMPGERLFRDLMPTTP